MHKLILPFFMLLSPLCLKGESYNISAIAGNEGLSNSSVNCIFQDSKHRIWLGTWDGLNCYDGRNINVYKSRLDDNESLSNGIIRNILPSVDDDYIWVATDHGINLLNTTSGKCRRFFYNPQVRDISSEEAFLIAEGKDGDIYALVLNNGIFRYDESAGDFIRIDCEKEYSSAAKILCDRSGRLFILGRSGNLNVFSIKGNRLEASDMGLSGGVNNFFFNREKDLILLQKSDNSVYISEVADIGKTRSSESTELKQIGGSARKGNLNAAYFTDNEILMGFDNGLYRAYTTDREYNLSAIIESAPILSVIEGTQSVIWSGTDMQGVLRIYPENIYFKGLTRDTPQNYRKRINAVRSFAQDSNGRIWIGTKGHGIFAGTITGEGIRVNAGFTKEDGLTDNNIYKIAQDLHDDVLWIGSDGNGLDYYSLHENRIRHLAFPSDTTFRSVYSIVQTAEDTLWAGTAGHGLWQLTIDRSTSPFRVSSFRHYYKSTSGKSLNGNIVYSIIKADNDHLWVGTRDGGLCLFSTKDGTCSYGSNDIAEFSSGSDVICLHKDAGHNLWVGTTQGLYRFDPNSRLASHFDSSGGLTNTTVHGISEDCDHNIWVSTSGGLFRINDKVTPFDSSFGLQDNEFSDGAFLSIESGNRLVFGGIRGLNIFTPRQISSSDYSPPILIENIFVDGQNKDFDASQELRLPSSVNSFGFNIIPIDYISSDKCGITYFLEGYQKEWINIGSSSSVVFTNVPVGKYTLKVRSYNRNNSLSKEIYSLPIRIYPPFYLSLPAILIYFLLFGVFIYYLYSVISDRNRNRLQVKKEAAERLKTMEIAESKMSFFGNIAHELSNTLTLIYSPCMLLLEKGSISSKDRKYLDVIVSNTERLLTLTQQILDFRKAETGHLKLRIRSVELNALMAEVMEKFKAVVEENNICLRLELDSGNLTWNTDSTAFETIFFNLLSNAVKYTPPDNEITVCAHRKGEVLYLSVRNTGIGINEEFRQNIFNKYEVLNLFEKAMVKGSHRSSGIGLALSKSLAGLLGGDISMESDGSTYTFMEVRLPMQPLAESDFIEDEDTTRQDESGRNGISSAIQKRTAIKASPYENHISYGEKKQTLLIVDDEEVVRGLILSFLSGEYEIKEARDGAEALRIIKDQTIDLIISDILMPEMDGYSLSREIKGDESTSHIPIILLSSRRATEDLIHGVESGADAYLVKPFKPKYLEVVVKRLLRHNKEVASYSSSHWAAVEQYKGKTISREDKAFITDMTELIYKNMSSGNLKVEFIADTMGMSPVHLHRKVKDLLGITPIDYINQQRLSHAEHLLLSTNLSVKEIMYDCGFSSRPYFIKIFTAHFGCTPGAYRGHIGR